MFFIDEYKTKYVSVGYYTARDYQHLLELSAIRRGGSSNSLARASPETSTPLRLFELHTPYAI